MDCARMVLISVKVPVAYLRVLDKMVKEWKMFPNRSEAIRTALWELIRRELDRRGLSLITIAEEGGKSGEE